MLELLISELWVADRRPLTEDPARRRLFGDLAIKANGIDLPGPEDVRNSVVSINNWVHDLIRLRKMIRLAYTKQEVSAGTAADFVHVYSRANANEDDVLLKVVNLATGAAVKGFEELHLSARQIVEEAIRFRRHVQSLLLASMPEPSARNWWLGATFEEWDAR